MINISTKPDIIRVIENEGIELKPKGKYLWSLCPFHFERHPSFKIDPERQSFYCFGCHEHGDVVTFIQKHRGLSFKESLGYLGINGRRCNSTLKEIKKRELIKQFKAWCNDYHDDLCCLYRTLQRAKEKAKTTKQVEAFAEFYHKESTWLYQIGILQGNDDQAKFELYKELLYGH